MSLRNWLKNWILWVWLLSILGFSLPIYSFKDSISHEVNSVLDNKFVINSWNIVLELNFPHGEKINSNDHFLEYHWFKYDKTAWKLFINEKEVDINRCSKIEINFSTDRDDRVHVILNYFNKENKSINSKVFTIKWKDK